MAFVACNARILVFMLMQSVWADDNATCTNLANCRVETTITQSTTLATTENLLPGLPNWNTSGDATSTTSGGNNYCVSGANCTGYQGGTFYTDLIKLNDTMSVEEIQAGFILDYGVTVRSHSSNADLPLCANTNGDCKDSLTIALELFNNNESVEKFTHSFVLDYAGLRNYSFSQPVKPNDYQTLDALMSLTGRDDGYGSGLWGPQFTDAYLLSTYMQIEYITNEIYRLIENSLMDDYVLDVTNSLNDRLDRLVSLESIEMERLAIIETTRIEAERLAQLELERLEAEAAVIDLIAEIELETEQTEIPTVTVEIQTSDANLDDQTDATTSTIMAQVIPPIEVPVVDVQMPIELEAEIELAAIESYDLDVPEIELTVESFEVAAAPIEAQQTAAPVEAETAEVAENSPVAVENDASTAPRTASTPSESEKKAPETSKKVASQPKSKPTKQEIARRVAVAIMEKMSESYNSSQVQNVALAAMTYGTDISSYNNQLVDNPTWYQVTELHGGTNYDHPHAMWWFAEENELYLQMEDAQWQR